MYRTILSLLLLLLGAAMAAGGAWLAWLGGSLYYLFAGIGIGLSGWLLLRRYPEGLFVYALTLFGTLIWAVWEVGFDWWALAPRGALLVALGILILLPPMVRHLRPRGMPRRDYGLVSGFLLLAILVSAGVAGVSAFTAPHDLAGSFTSAQMQAGANVETDGVPEGEWQAYGRTSYGRRYSPLDQITPENGGKLDVAWTYQTGQVRGDKDPGETTYEVTPLVFDDTMYVCTPFATVIALDPVTGEEKWRFDPQLKQPPSQTTQHMTCRGVSYFDGSRHPRPQQQTPSGEDQVAAAETETDRVAQSAAEVTTQAAGVPQNVVTGNAEPGAPNPTVERDASTTASISNECVKRLFVPTSDGRLISISAETGEICPGFGGEDGTVNLWANMPNVTPGSFYSTSPPVVTDHLIVVGGTVNDNASVTDRKSVV